MATTKRDKAKRRSAGRKTIPFPAEAAMHRAAKRAREVARRYGTPVHYMKDGKIVAEIDGKIVEESGGFL